MSVVTRLFRLLEDRLFLFAQVCASCVRVYDQVQQCCLQRRMVLCGPPTQGQGEQSLRITIKATPLMKSADVASLLLLSSMVSYWVLMADNIDVNFPKTEVCTCSVSSLYCSFCGPWSFQLINIQAWTRGVATNYQKSLLWFWRLSTVVGFTKILRPSDRTLHNFVLPTYKKIV